MGHSTDTRIVGVSSRRKNGTKKDAKTVKKGLDATEERQKRADKIVLTTQQKRQAKLDRLRELSFNAAETAIADFIQSEKDDMAENCCSESDNDSEDIDDRVQPPGPGSLVFVPLAPRAKAATILSNLELANKNDSKEADSAKKWLAQRYGLDCERYIKAVNEGYSGVVIPLSNAEAIEHKKEKERKTFFLVSFDYHH